MKRLQYILIFCVALLAIEGNGQELHFVELGVNGLHCSACSFTVEKALKKVDGVSVVQMDLNERSGKIYFAENETAVFPALTKAVTDAGYSVRFLNVHLKNELAIGEQCALLDYCLTDEVKNANAFQLLGEKYLPKKEWKNLKSNLPTKKCADCNATAIIRPLEL